jgi:hypothetical protein
LQLLLIIGQAIWHDDSQQYSCAAHTCVTQFCATTKVL